MKRYFLLVLSLIFFQLCQADDLYRWERIDAEFDGLAAQCEKANYDDSDRKKFAATVEKMERIAARSGSRQLQARALYWKVWRLTDVPTDTVLRWLDHAIALTDSVAFRYDFLRLQLTKAGFLRVKGQYLESYVLCKEVAEAWRQQKDWFQLAKAEVQLGAVLNELNENNLALRYYEQAGEHFKRADNPVCETKNRINVCTALYFTNQVEEARKILIQLTEDPIAKADTTFYVNVLASLSSIPGREIKEWALWAWRLARQTDDPQLVCLAGGNMGGMMLELKRPEEALDYYRRALASSYSSPQGILCTLYQGMQETFEELGQADSAAYYKKKVEEAQASVESQTKVSDMEMRGIVQKINALETESQQAGRRHLWVRIAIAAGATVGLVCIAVVIFFLIRVNKKKVLFRHETHKLRRANDKIQAELDTKNRALASTTIADSEREQLLDELAKEIYALREANKIAEEDGEQLLQHLRSGRKLNEYRSRLEDVNPQIQDILTERHPLLTDKDIRLCAYINAGLSIKEIADLTNSLPEAINTARSRLRKKLGLPKDTTLEDYLQDL